ncbi:hypothetical protein BHE74_00018253 [Ensete ventricosum]|nr:hypothetical protein BHE74_00018253 [Ensete ventricosum]RZR97981.1 hypothetical protein BHM03_00027280 [Ensete ventricosum]
MQIRVHLHCAGHPIANDMLYLSEDVPSRSASGVGADRAASGTCKPPMSNSHKVDSFAEDSASEEFSIDPMCTNCPNLPPKGYDQFSFPNPVFPITLQMISLSRFCCSASDYLNVLCFRPIDVFFIYFPYRYDEDEEGIWLHCVRYSGPGWSYECPYPDWAHLC